jgi:hypothetical protein
VTTHACRTALDALSLEHGKAPISAVKGSAIRALVKQEKTLSVRFLTGFAAQLFRTISAKHTNLRFRRLIRMLPTLEVSAAIRSVSHLDLARCEMMIGKRNQLSNRKERTGFLPPGSLRLGFVGQPFFYHACPLWQARAFTNPAPIPPSAGPENLQCRAAFIQFRRDVVPKPQPRCFRGPTRC